jgi:hypothetical protein
MGAEEGREEVVAGAGAAGGGKSGAGGPGSWAALAAGAARAGCAPGRGFGVGAGGAIRHRAIAAGGRSSSRVEEARAPEKGEKRAYWSGRA